MCCCGACGTTRFARPPVSTPHAGSSISLPSSKSCAVGTWSTGKLRSGWRVLFQRPASATSFFIGTVGGTRVKDAADGFLSLHCPEQITERVGGGGVSALHADDRASVFVRTVLKVDDAVDAAVRSLAVVRGPTDCPSSDALLTTSARPRKWRPSSLQQAQLQVLRRLGTVSVPMSCVLCV